jgi:hypothetical protein
VDKNLSSRIIKIVGILPIIVAALLALIPASIAKSKGREKFIDTLYTTVFSEKIKNNELHCIEDYLDENVIETAKNLGRIYGQRIYYNHLADELEKYGLDKDKIDQLISIEKERRRYG